MGMIINNSRQNQNVKGNFETAEACRSFAYDTPGPYSFSPTSSWKCRNSIVVMVYFDLETGKYSHYRRPCKKWTCPDCFSHLREKYQSIFQGLFEDRRIRYVHQVNPKNFEAFITKAKRRDGDTIYAALMTQTNRLLVFLNKPIVAGGVAVTPSYIDFVFENLKCIKMNRGKRIRHSQTLTPYFKEARGKVQGNCIEFCNIEHVKKMFTDNDCGFASSGCLNGKMKTIFEAVISDRIMPLAYRDIPPIVRIWRDGKLVFENDDLESLGQT